MNKSPQNYTNEQTGISYTLAVDGNYFIPDLTLPDEPEYDIGRFGLMRRHYLKNHRKGIFSAMLMSGKLDTYLAEIDQTANERLEFISRQMVEREGVTESLKSDNQMLWVGKMSNIRNRVEEIIKVDLIYS